MEIEDQNPIFKYNIERLNELINDKDVAERHRAKLRSLVIHLTRADNSFFLKERRHPKEHWPTNNYIYGTDPYKDARDATNSKGGLNTDSKIKFDWGTLPDLPNMVTQPRINLAVDKNHPDYDDIVRKTYKENPDAIVVGLDGMGVNDPDDPRLKFYKLLRDYVTPTETIRSGVIKTGYQWLCKFDNLKKEDFAIKTAWFELVKERTYSESDLEFCFNRSRTKVNGVFYYPTFADYKKLFYT